jgi:hypothetical protein
MDQAAQVPPERPLSVTCSAMQWEWLLQLLRQQPAVVMLETIRDQCMASIGNPPMMAQQMPYNNVGQQAAFNNPLSAYDGQQASQGLTDG